MQFGPNDSTVVKAHGILLLQRNSYFKRMLEENPEITSINFGDELDPGMTELIVRYQTTRIGLP
jgi:hypothetical protein